MRCKSPICTVKDGVRGIEFTPAEDSQGMHRIWCPGCIRLSKELVFWSGETAEMIRDVYRAYIDTDLPREVKLILEQFAREIVQKLNEEL